MNDTYHYPPDLFDLVVQTIPLLNRSKKGVLTFFNGAGVEESLYRDVSNIVANNPDSISKFEICRKILERINQNTDKYLRQRRELLKRITEFEAFSTCWESDQLKAKGLVSEIQKIINVKDSFTRMNQERENEQKLRRFEHEKKVAAIQKRKRDLESIRSDFFALFNEFDPQKRGKSLEKVLNGYFALYEILIKENFKRSEEGDGIIEQIDGVIELDHQIFLVEMKWKGDKISNSDIFTHLGRIYHRANANGIIISASGYTSSGIIAAKEALVKNALLVMFDLEEFVKVIEAEIDFKSYLRDKISTAILDKNPYKRP